MSNTTTSTKYKSDILSINVEYLMTKILKMLSIFLSYVCSITINEEEMSSFDAN